MKQFLFVLILQLLIMSSLAQEKRGSLWKALNTPAGGSSADDDYYGDQALRYEDRIYKKSIRTVQLRDSGFDRSQPILNLDSDERLILSFDDLDADLKSYMYTIIHCNANWEPSGLVPSEYIEGFQDNSIIDYRYSFNTLVPYTHYNASFPTNSTRLTKSGNYLLKVYLSGEPDNIAITRRFMVFQPKITIESTVRQASIIEDRNYRHELDFTILRNSYEITNPYGDLQVFITQNNRWDNIKSNMKPVYIRDQELVYDFDEANVFKAGNEFRNFDIKSVRYLSERIYKVSRDSITWNVELYHDEKRNIKRYYTWPDINGDFHIRVQEGNNSDVEADYVFVNFFLSSKEVFTDGNLYVFGAWNSWQCNSANLMHYNVEKEGYECRLLMKQGYYNYQYAFLKDGETAADDTFIEGSHYETENDYTIYVYHRQPGTFYDQLIGVKRLNSARDF